MTLPTINETSANTKSNPNHSLLFNSNSSNVSQYISIPCYVSCQCIQSISITCKSLRDYPSHIVAVLYNPTNAINVISQPFPPPEEKKYKFTPTFPAHEKIPFSLWKHVDDDTILPQQMELEITLMTDKDKIFLGKTTLMIKLETVNYQGWFDVAITGKTKKIKRPFWKTTKYTNHHSFADYPQNLYSLNSAKLKLRLGRFQEVSVNSSYNHSYLNLSRSPTRIKTIQIQQHHQHQQTVRNPNIPTSIPGTVESTGSQLTDPHLLDGEKCPSSQQSDCERMNEKKQTRVDAPMNLNSNADRYDLVEVRKINTTKTSKRSISTASTEPTQGSLDQDPYLNQYKYPYRDHEQDQSHAIISKPDSVSDSMAAMSQQLRQMEEVFQKMKEEREAQTLFWTQQNELNKKREQMTREELVQEAIRHVKEEKEKQQDQEREQRKLELDQWEKSNNVESQSQMRDLYLREMTEYSQAKNPLVSCLME